MSKIKLVATDGNGGTISLKGPTTTDGNAEFELTLPANDGSAGQYLKTDGSGALSWDTVTAVGGANEVTFNDQVKIKLGTDAEYEIYNDNTNLIIDQKADGLTSYIRAKQNGTILFDASDTGNQVAAKFKWSNDSTPVSSAELYYGGAKKAETVTGGFTVTGTCTATSFAGSGAALTGISSPLSFRNLLVNGAMTIAQRGTSSTSGGRQTVDGMMINDNNTNVTITQSQNTLTSSDTGPWELGFRKSFKIALSAAGNGLDGTSYIEMYKGIEAQDLAQSGWDYTSSSSKVTLSFWVKVSTNQTFYCSLRAKDGSNSPSYPFSFTASGNNTWTKITHSIPGVSGLTFDNDAGTGLQLRIIPYFGGDYTNNSRSLNTWATHDSAAYTPDNADTWITAGTSTFEVTGLQLETGATATTFEHKPYRQILEDCRRYLWVWSGGISMHADRTTDAHNCGRVGQVFFPTTMRAAPTVTNMSMTVYTGSAQTLGTYEIDTDHIWFNHSGSFSDGRAWARINSFTASAEI